MLNRWTLLAATTLLCLNANAKVWETRAQWNMEYENKFSVFIKNLPLDVFSNRSSKYYGISTDCADAVYALRILFAYENGLPVRFQGSDRLSNETNDFDNIPEENYARVRKFMARVNYGTGTESLHRDTYPIAINRSMIRPGAMFVHSATVPGMRDYGNVSVTYRTGHVYYLQDVQNNGMIKYISSTVPIAVRPLGARMGIQFAPQENVRSGYRAWKWPHLSSEQQPGYSMMQFQIGGWRPYSKADLANSWQEAFQSRIRTRGISAKEQLEATSFNLRSTLLERAAAVDRGWRFYQSRYRGQSCMSAGDYDDHSTPSRDVKIQTEIYNFMVAVRRYVQSIPSWEDEMTMRNREYQNFVVEVMPGVRIGFSKIHEVFMTQRALEISEPEHSPEVRWGLRNQGRWVCPQRAKQYVGGHLAGQD